MSSAQVVYSNVTQSSNVSGKLFDGRKFWLSRRCPLRSTFINDIEKNGGTVVPLEKQADWLIVDHTRGIDSVVGGISYKFIEECIKAGEVLDSFPFACGPAVGSVRPIGSVSRPAKGSRNPFTAEDDLILTEWVISHVQGGGADGGNAMYQDLEVQNSRHTWQSWRDRWVKRLRHLHPNIHVIANNNTPPTPPSDENEVARPPTRPIVRTAVPNTGVARSVPTAGSFLTDPLVAFSAAEFHELFRVAGSIQEMTVRESKKAFAAWANDGDGKNHTGEEWQTLWDMQVQPVYEVVEAEKGRMKVYKENWVNWNSQNEEATAGDWIAYWRRGLKSLVARVVSGREETEPWDDEDNEDVEEASEEENVTTSAEGDKSEQPGESQLDGAYAPAESPAHRRAAREDRPTPTPPTVTKLKWRPNPFSSHSSPTGKRSLNEAGIQDDPEVQNSPESKRRRTELNSATEAGRMLNAVLEQTPSKGNLEEPIEIFDSGSSGSEEVELEPAVVAEELPRDTPERDAEEAENQPESSPRLRIASPTLSFSNFPSDVPDQTQFPEIMSQEPDIDLEAVGSSPPFRVRVLDTQAILEANTQPIQFSIPDPRLFDNDMEEPIDIPSEIDSDIIAEDPPDASPPMPLSQHIAKLVAQGHAEANILIALRSTSMDRQLASIVLASLEAGRGIPELVSGIWTQKDDEDAEGGDARMIRRVREKHGEKGLGGYIGRLEFLRQYRLR